MYNCGYFLSSFLSARQYVIFIAFCFIFFVVYCRKVLFTGPASLLGIILIALGASYNLYMRWMSRCIFDYWYTGVSYINFPDVLVFMGFSLIILKHLIYVKGGGS